MIQRGAEVAFLMIDRVVPISMIEKAPNEALATQTTFRLFKDNGGCNLSI